MKKVFKGIQYEKYYKDLLPYFKKQKNQHYFTAILTLGASIFFALFAINPTISTIVKLRKEIEDSRFVETKLTQKITSLSNLSTEYTKIQEDIPYILDAIPDQPEAPTLTSQIQSIAKSANVKITDLQISPIGLTSQSTSSSSSSFNFSLTGESSYENLQKFISELINMQRILSIDSISLSKSTNTGADLQLDLKGSAFYKKQ